jgi:hypothetical protein
VKKRQVAARRLTHGEKSALEDKILRQGGTHWLKIPPEALPPEIRKRYDEMMVGLKATAPSGRATIAILAAEAVKEGA